MAKKVVTPESQYAERDIVAADKLLRELLRGKIEPGERVKLDHHWNARGRGIVTLLCHRAMTITKSKWGVVEIEFALVGRNDYIRTPAALVPTAGLSEGWAAPDVVVTQAIPQGIPFLISAPRCERAAWLSPEEVDRNRRYERAFEIFHNAPRSKPVEGEVTDRAIAGMLEQAIAGIRACEDSDRRLAAEMALVRARNEFRGRLSSARRIIATDLVTVMTILDPSAKEPE